MTPSVLRPEIFTGLPHVVAGFTTRHGGVSPAPFSSFNLGINTADDPQRVAENQAVLLASVGFPAGQAVRMKQVHGAEIEVVTEAGVYADRDGVVTQTPHLLLMVGVADCAAVLLADEEAGVIGACHSGWRGTVARITPKTIQIMTKLGANPARIRAYISPCIGTAQFEVGEEVAAQFDSAFVHRHPDWPKPHIDLKGVILHQLTESGVPEAQIECSSACTVTNRAAFFSFRAENGQTGRMMGFIGRLR